MQVKVRTLVGKYTEGWNLFFYILNAIQNSKSSSNRGLSLQDLISIFIVNLICKNQI